MPAGRLHVLATEDDPTLRDLLTEILEEEGYRVTMSSTADVAEVIREAPDLVLLDGRGPGPETAWAFLERLKADLATAAIPILILTGIGREAEVHAVRLAELDTVLVHKPFDLDNFVEQVRRRLAGESA